VPAVQRAHITVVYDENGGFVAAKQLFIVGPLGVSLLLAGCAAAGLADPSAPAHASQTPPRPAETTQTNSSSSGTTAGLATLTIRYPQIGGRKWTIAAGRSSVAGRSGILLRFQVAVEKGITGIDPQQFAQDVFTTLGDSRSWTAGGQYRFQRVGPGEARDFTVYLATPATRDALCDDGYDRYTSCRNGDKVALNVARWAHGVPNYGAALTLYHQYMVNHEVGHRLGHGHELCPGRGSPAPVMEQQTLGLHGCLPNPWPYLNGARYAGRSGQYNDPLPAA
jgi:hypothetical protein